MLFPFFGYVPAEPEPITSALASRRARRLRDAARRYQPASVISDAVSAGVLRGSGAPRLYGYRVDGPRGRVVEGIVGVTSAAQLVPHEETRDSLVDPAPPVEIRPILVVSRSPAAVSLEVAEAHHPAIVIDGVWRHTLWPLPSDRPLFEDDRFVIADGHHRSRSVLATSGPDAQILALVVPDGGRGLSVGTFHRRFSGVGGLPPEISNSFKVSPTRRRGPHPNAIVWVSASGDRYLLRPHDSVLSDLSPPLRASMAAVAASALYPLIGVAESEARYVPSTVSAARGLADDEVALLLPSVPMSAVMASAEARIPFPPKGTRFDPKPVRGLVIRAAG